MRFGLPCSGEFEYFPSDPKGYKLVLVNLRKSTNQVPYNDRRRSCENVAATINKASPRGKSYAMQTMPCWTK